MVITMLVLALAANMEASCELLRAYLYKQAARPNQLQAAGKALEAAARTGRHTTVSASMQLW